MNNQENIKPITVTAFQQMLINKFGRDKAILLLAVRDIICIGIIAIIIIVGGFWLLLHRDLLIMGIIGLVGIGTTLFVLYLIYNIIMLTVLVIYQRWSEKIPLQDKPDKEE